MKFFGLSEAAASFALISLFAGAGQSAPAEPDISAADLPRVLPTPPEKAVGTFQVKSGSRLELAAAEPEVMDPIALSFDENGRLFVVEMRDYSEHREERLGRIRLLEDTNGDGRFDRATVFADNLPWPTAVICYDGGVFVAATPDLLYLKDRNGDGVADDREVVFTGFGIGVQRLNVQQLVNSFAWGLDNRIHGANGGNGGVITSPAQPGRPALDLRGRDFSFDPRTRQLQAESGGGQYGMSFDDHGRKFVCSNSSHIRAVMFEDRYVARNPALAMPSPAVDIAVDGPAAEVYRLSPEEPWRVIRTKWRVAGLVPGPVEGGGRASGYFTSATGITIYRGDAWPEDFRGNAFVADCGSNLVHRKRVLSDGVSLRAERPADEVKTEFLASRDVWFRPVQMANAPDGALYIIDMYREVIEHPWSFPASIKRHLDLDSGNDRGRIYRLVPDGFRRRPAPRLREASVHELVATLEHPNGWHRDTAARLLYERQDQAAVPPLRRLLSSSRSGLACLHALYALNGLGALQSADLSFGLARSEPFVRQHSLRLLETIPAADQMKVASADTCQSLANDADPVVRYQFAYTLGGISVPGKLTWLRQILQRGAEDSWVHLAVLNSLGEDTGEFLALLAEDGALRRPGLEPFARQLMTLVGARHQRVEMDQALTVLTQTEPRSLACALGNALGEGTQRAGTTLSRVADPGKVEALLRGAQALWQDSATGQPARLAALRLLGQGAYALARQPLRDALAPGQPAAVQSAALDALGNFADAHVPQAILSAWEGLTPALRNRGIEILLRRAERIDAALDALEAGQLRRSDFSASQMEFLRQRPDAAVRARAAKLLGQAPVGDRQEVIHSRLGALRLAGDARHGAAIYLERCASCHRLAGQGHALGPDLETVRSSGKDILLSNILDPNREVMPKYVSYLAETRDDESVTGIIGMETDSTVVLRQPNGVEATLMRSALAQFRSLGQSAMPEGLEEGLSDQDLADLLDYILTGH
ncbi:MAG: PVC-type heme-binding CxxCH protein [Verrucomicrobiota bacterium]